MPFVQLGKSTGSSPLSLSPWALLQQTVQDGFNGFNLSPVAELTSTKLALSGHPGMSQRTEEHNKFAHSFASAMTEEPAANEIRRAVSPDAQVPDMSASWDRALNSVPVATVATPAKQAPKRRAAPATPGADRVVPAPRGGKSKTEMKATHTHKKTASSKPAGKHVKAGAGARARREETRREKRREQNRINAAKCRERKLNKVSELEAALDVLWAENQQLKQSCSDFERKLKAAGVE